MAIWRRRVERVATACEERLAGGENIAYAVGDIVKISETAAAIL